MRSDAKPTPEKRCTICGARFQRKRLSSGVLEDYQAFMRRQFCSLSCANSRTKGGLSRKAFHAQARKLRKSNCEACGTARRLHAHHKNEDWRDNRPENIQTLCVFCHQFWHAMHRRRGVKPSGDMPMMLSPSSAGLPPEWDACAPTATRSSRRSPRSSSAPTEKSEPND